MDRTDIGQFPYNRGETPIFNFDIGDEDFLQVRFKKTLTQEFIHILSIIVKCCVSRQLSH